MLEYCKLRRRSIKIILRYGTGPIVATVLLAAGLIPGCARTPDIDKQQITLASDSPIFCKKPLKGKLLFRTELFFGLSEPDGSVITGEKFQRFVDNEVTPRFPDGFTLLTGAGQFKDAKGTLIKEEAKLLILLYPFTPENNQNIEKIRTAYKQGFRQQSVLRSDSMSCITF